METMMQFAANFFVLEVHDLHPDRVVQPVADGFHLLHALLLAMQQDNLHVRPVRALLALLTIEELLGTARRRPS